MQCLPKADVASSSKTMAGALRSVRAMATRCFDRKRKEIILEWVNIRFLNLTFSPPDNFKPRSPTTVLYPSGNVLIRSKTVFSRLVCQKIDGIDLPCISAVRAAFSTSRSTAPTRPYRIL